MREKIVRASSSCEIASSDSRSPAIRETSAGSRLESFRELLELNLALDRISSPAR
jgi:hypothetical protein